MRLISLTSLGLFGCGLLGCSLPAPPPGGQQPIDFEPDASVGNAGDDGVEEPDVDAAAPTPDAHQRMPQTLKQTSSGLIEPETSIACYDDDDDQAENSYFRVWNLPELGIDSSFHVVEVQVGVESSNGGDDGIVPVDVRLHTVTGDFTQNQLNTLATVSQQVTDQSATRLKFAFDADVPSGSLLAVEVHVPASNDDEFFIGANNDGQTAPGFLRAAECDDNGPVDLAQIGFPQVHMIIEVTGE
jgi:hypothetical protein